MTNFARSLARAAAPSSSTRRRPARFALVLSVTALLCLLVAPAANAVVTEVTAGTKVGLQPRAIGLETPSGKFANEEGNAIVSGSSVYAVYWDPGAWFHHEWVSGTDAFFQAMGASSGEFGTIFSALSQYRDRANAQASNHMVFKGAYTDFAPYPTAKCTSPEPLEFGQVACVTDKQIREQLEHFVAIQGTEKGMHAIYYVLTPPGVTVCLDEASEHCSDFELSNSEITKHERKSESYENSFCSYHGAINQSKAPQGDANTILYASIPWSAGFEGHPWNFFPGSSMEGWAFDCQDGGWNPEGGNEEREFVKPFTTAELEKLAELEPKEREEAERAHELLGPHIEEPNQYGRGEEGDYAPALFDPIANQIAVEQANIVTDPLLNGWQDSATGFEATDECRDVFAATAGASQILGTVKANVDTEAGTLSNESVAGEQWYINNVVNQGELHRARCAGGVGLVARFTAPNPVNQGEIVGFDGMETEISEAKASVYGPSGPPSTTYGTFSWNFGDGTPEVAGYAPGSPPCETPWLSPCAASIYHAYAYGGTYPVRLKVTDVGGNVSEVTHDVTVVGPPPPSPSTAGPGTSGGPGSGSGSGSGKGAQVPGKPGASAAVMSRKLSTALRNGLAVGYSVNEQVTGHFEVLLSRSLAKKLKIAGTPATGLPAGTPPELVIAKALLVTTKGGRSVVHVKFPKAVQARLRHAHSVPLMLRLIVRNAATGEPATTTVLSSFKLAG